MVSVLKQIKRVPKTGKQQTAKPLGKTKQTARKSTGGRNIARAREQLVQMAASSTGTSRQLSIGRRMGERIPAAATAGSRSSSTSSSAASRATMTRASAPTQAEMRAAETVAIAAATSTGGVGTSTSSISTRRTSVLVSGPNKERREVAVEGASAVAGVSVAGPFGGAVAGAAADNMRAGTRMEDDDRPRQPPAERGGDDADDKDADLGNLGGGMDDDDDDDVGAEAEAEETKEAAETEAEETQQNVAASRSTSGNGQVMVIFQQQGDRPDRRLVLGLHQKFSTVYRKIAKVDGRVPGTFTFLLDGVRILHRHTPAELELDQLDEEDEDDIRTIDVVENQEGGGYVY